MARKCIDIRKLPETMYSDVVKVREIVKYKLLNNAAKKEIKDSIPSYDGVSDVILYDGNSILGFTNRLELIKNYVRVKDGKPIKISRLHYNKLYIAMRGANETYKLLKIPKRAKYGVSIDGKDIGSNCFVLLRVVDGQMDLSRPKIIRGMDEVYAFRTQYSVVKLADLAKAKGKTYEIRQIKQIQAKREEVANTKVWSPKEADKVEDELVKAPYVAIYRIVAKNARTGKYQPYGFILRDTRINSGTGMGFNPESDVAKNLTSIKEMCMQKSIKNVTVATMQETNKIYFRGVGIKLDNLPQVDVNKVRMVLARMNKG